MERYNLHKVGNPKLEYKRKLHDRALKRAASARCKPYTDKPHLTNPPHKTLFVGKLASQTDGTQLLKEFSKYGNVVEAKVVKDLVVGDSKGYGFVEFETKNQACRAWEVITT